MEKERKEREARGEPEVPREFYRGGFFDQPEGDSDDELRVAFHNTHLKLLEGRRKERERDAAIAAGAPAAAPPMPAFEKEEGAVGRWLDGEWVEGHARASID